MNYIKKSFLILSFVMVAAVFVSCRNSVQGGKVPSGSDNEIAYISLNIEPAGRSANVESDDELLSKLKDIELKGKREGDDEEITIWQPDSETVFSELSSETSKITIQTGTWNFTFNATLEGVLFSDTINSKKIVAGNNTLSFKLAPQQTGGGFSIKLILQKSSAMAALEEDVLERIITTLQKLNDPDADKINKIFDLTGSDGNEKIITSDDTYELTYTCQACDENEKLEAGTYYLTFDIYTKGNVNAEGDLVPVSSPSFVIQIKDGFNSYLNNPDKAQTILLGSIYKIIYNKNDDDSDVKAEFVDNIVPEFVSNNSGEFKLPDITRQGYEFLGWYYRGKKITKIDASTLKDNVNLYAKWQRYANASGEIITEDGLLDISVKMPEKLYRNAGTFTFEAKMKGSEDALSAEVAANVSWYAFLMYQGMPMDMIYTSETYYEYDEDENTCSITKPLPVAGNYQIFVAASLNDEDLGSTYTGSTTSHTFDFEIPADDYLFEINNTWGDPYDELMNEINTVFYQSKGKPLNITLIGDTGYDSTGVNPANDEFLHDIGNSMRTYNAGEIVLDCSELAGVTSIEADYANSSSSVFTLTKLTKIILPKSLETIKANSLSCSFFDDVDEVYITNLDYVEIPDTVVNIEDNAFGINNIIKEFKFYQAGETSNINSVYSTMYDDALLLKTSTIQGTDETEKNIIAVAKGADVEIIDFSNEILSHYTEVPVGLFMNMENLHSVILGENITKIGFYSFANSGITSISIPKVEEIGIGAFASTPNLESIDFATDRTVTIGQEAFNNSGIKTVYLPKTVYFTPTEDEKPNKAFWKCKNLNTVTIASDFENEIDTSIFDRCPGITSFVIDGTGGDYSAPLNGMFLVKNNAIISVAQGSLESATIDFTDSGITEIPEFVFAPDPDLKISERPSFTIASFGSVTKINQNAFDGANLTGIEDFGSVTEIGEEAFKDTAISTISFDTLSSTITSIPKGTFQGTKLTEITSFGTINNISPYAFYGSSLITIPPLKDGMTIGDKAFKNTNINSLVLKSSNITVSTDYLSSSNPDGIELTLDFPIDMRETPSVTIDGETIPIMQYLSYYLVGGIKGITKAIFNQKVYLPDLSADDEPEEMYDEELDKYYMEYTYRSSISNGGYRIFNSARKTLNSITFKGDNSEIGSYQFHNFKELTTLTFSGNGTKINKNAFNDSNEFHSGAANLTSIDLTGVTVIGENAFFGCLSGVDVVIPESVIAVAPYAFGNYENCPDSITVEGEDNWYSADGAYENTWLSWINGTEPDSTYIIATVFGDITGFDPTIENCLLTQNTNYYFRYVQSQP